MSLHQVILLTVVIVAAATLSEMVRRHRATRLELARAEDERDHERNQRLVYERALGLPVFSEESRDADLWARASQGDEIACLIIEERLNLELFDQAGPLVLSGDSNTQGTSSQDRSSLS